MIRPALRDWLWMTAVLVIGALAFFAGQIIGYIRNDVARGNRDVERIEAILRAHSDKLGLLTINRGPLDKFRIEGSLETQDDLDFLHQELIRTLGEDRAKTVIAVEVAQ